MLSPDAKHNPQPAQWQNPRLVAAVLAIAVWAIYLSTMARGLILGDPTEYTFVANLPAIAHPPGYAFITLVGWLFQHAIPLGDYPWRMHLVATVSGTISSVAVFGVIYQVASPASRWRIPAGVAMALLAATAANLWQHSIHANPHVMTATFLAVNLFFLIRWSILPDNRRWQWLWLFCISASLGATHHPLTVFTFPAYAIFIVLVRPRLLLEWRRLLAMIGFALLGLLPLLYYPLISATQPLFGPHTMNTLDGFLAHVLARGLSESLPYYGWVDQPQRLVVFWSIVRMQFAWVLLFSIGGLLLKKPLLSPTHHPSPTAHHLVLLAMAFLINYAFVITLKQQDIMAYIQGPLLVLIMLMGIGLIRLLDRWPQVAWGIMMAVFIFGPIWNAAVNGPRISLRQFDEGDRYVAEVFDYFDGRGEGVVLLNNWEFMTPLWYTHFVEERWPDPADVRPEFVSAAEPWLPSVFNYLPGGPVYLNGYRREIIDAGFRLRPRGVFYQVVEPGDKTIPSELTSLIVATAAEDGDNPPNRPLPAAEVLAFNLPDGPVQAGDFVPLTLALRSAAGTADYFVPVVQVGTIQYEFTTDSHLISPVWQAGEVVVERFDFALPHDLPAGVYDVTVRLRNLSQQSDLSDGIKMGELVVEKGEITPATDDLLANFRQRVGLKSAVVRSGATVRRGPWETPLVVRPGDVVVTHLNWEVLDYAEESYTVFVHLIDPANQLYVALDYTPLGGAVPSHLWFPKWLPGQQMTDPYRMEIPETLPPGSYLIEVGLYEMTSGRRLHIHNANGDIIGDRYIVGGLDVQP